MKLTVVQKQKVELDAVAIQCVLPVRYEEDDMPNDYPFRKNDVWNVTIDIATGQIRDWPTGVPPRELYMKVTDSGSYFLLGHDRTLAEIDEDYVPSCLPQKYGDYVTFNIDAAGIITNWEMDAQDVADSFFGDDDED